MGTAHTQLQVLGEHPGSMRVARWKNVVVVAWSGPATSAATDTLARIMVPLHAGSSEVRSYVHLVPSRMPLPDAKARGTFTEIMATYESYIACVGVILAGSGFWASAMRNMVIGLRLLVRTPFDYRVHTEIEELFDWLPEAHEQRTSVALPRDALSTLLSEARTWQLERAAFASIPRV